MTDRFIELLWRAGATLTGYGSFRTKFAATAVLITIVHFGVKRARGIYRTRKFRAAAAQKRVQCDAVKQHLKEKLHTDDTVVLQKRDEIVKLSAIDLALALKRRHYTAVEVLHAYQAKALEVTERINCVTEFLTEAEQWANDLDEKGPENAGCLFGVPVSIKENVDIKGYPSTAGQVKFLFPVDKDATIVKTLKLQGAVPFVKTNVPQSLLW
ncbi:PREDICTED: vitamin D3 hydroxylase-associated protein-like [Priapulus caudatus]|uniref:Vitamin D3 hydroxylase-associated protein-like n=1 Tax=Priapulus caudatus TaxID=37621 RepID=A0ABM1DPH7_PRICU|nr:PREDICTED: vitamin D3 hydroxylase-associated protein-like [Priapulus caudatus]